MRPFIEFDPDVDAGYIRLTTAQVEDSEEIAPGIVLDFDKENQLVGVEVLSVHQQMDGDIKSIADLFPNILTDEISRYSDHYSRAFTDPINFLSHNLRLFSNDKTLTRVYDKFVADLTIRSGVSVEMAKNNFIHLAEVCIQELIETNWIYPFP
jgi:uncharacterized protein YuzE